MGIWNPAVGYCI